MSDSMQSNDFSSGSDSFKEHIPHHSLFSDSRAGIRLQNALETLTGMGQEAEERFQESLKELREMPEEVVLELAQAFDDKCQPNDYPTKWGLVFLATELKHDAAFPFLKKLVFTPIPPERSRNPHDFSTVGEETILRTTAVEGLGYFVERGREDALEALLESLDIPSLSITRAAIQTLRSTQKLDDNMRQRILEILPKSRHFLLDLKRVAVHEVEQISDPESDLKPLPEGVERKEKNPAPRFDFDQPNEDESPRMNK